MSSSSETTGTLEKLARLEVARKYHPGHAQFWSDGQRRRTPAKWLFNGTNASDMHLNDAAKLLLSHHENTQIAKEHEDRKSVGRQHFASTNQRHIQGTKSISVPTSCDVDVLFHHHRTDAPIVLENGCYLPARVLLIRLCTFEDCEKRHTQQLHDLDICEIYSNAALGLPVHIYSIYKGNFLHDCVGDCLRYVGFQLRMIEKCCLIGFGDYKKIFRFLKISDPFNWNRAQFARLFDAGMLHIHAAIMDTPSNVKDHLCYQCFSDRFGSDNFAPGPNNIMEDTGKHLPKKFEGSKYVKPVFGGLHVPVPWYNRQVHFNVHK